MLHGQVAPIVGAAGSGSPGSGPFTTIRRYEELKGPGGPGVLGEEQKRSKLTFGPCWGFSPGGPENRIRGAILRILLVGELRGMTFKLFYAKLREDLLSPLLLAPPFSATAGCIVQGSRKYCSARARQYFWPLAWPISRKYWCQ